MSKNVEQKALEEYPKSYVDENIGSREGYTKGYNQAFQDFLEKAERAFLALYNSPLEKFERFKNYLKNEM